MASEPTAETAPAPAAPPPRPPVGLAAAALPPPKPTPPAALPPIKHDWLGALLSYLIPGLGQVYQGRIGKGLLFFGCLYLLFFYGQWMGSWRNVWLPDATHLPATDISLRVVTFDLHGVPKALAYRPQFLAQFWMGVAAWPACIQYRSFDRNDPAGLPIIHAYQRTPTEAELNDLQRTGNKRWDLGWVFTVIAGVLNLLVIYDAFAGPMFRDVPAADKPAEPVAAGGSPPSPPAPEAATP